MKWIAWILLIANVGLYLWGSGHKGSPVAARFSAQQDVASTAMTLLAETEKAASTAPGEPPPSCLRVGPFSALSSLAAARSYFVDNAVEPRDLVVPAREIRAFRVYLGPFSSAAETEVVGRNLDALGLRDHYVIRDAGPGKAISLGLFSQQGGADRLVAEVAHLGIKAATRAESRPLGPVYWLELTPADTARIDPRALPVIDWGDSRARARLGACGIQPTDSGSSDD